MSNLLEQNLKFISRYNPELAEKIMKHTELQANYEINPANSGDSILFKEGIPVDDSVDPVWSSMEIYSKLEDKSVKSITVILGMGLGYILKEFNKRYKGKIILFEPNLEFLRIALEFVDFSEELSNKNVIIAHTLEDVKNAFNMLFYRGYKYNFAASNYYLNNNIIDLPELTKDLNNCYITFEQTYNNLLKKNLLWTSILFNNVPCVVQSQDMHVLKDQFKGKTAVIISAGPSLDKNIENLKPFRDKVIVFCIGVAFRSAVKHGIIPDFVMIIDNDKSVIDLPEISQVNLIISTYSNTNNFELKPKRFYNYHIKTTPACTWLAKVLGVPDIDDYESAGTVAINCIHAAKLMGCKRIILIGQDLAYTDNKCYSQSSAYSGLVVNEDKTVEDENKDKENTGVIRQDTQFLSRDLVYVRGQNGEKLLSRPDYCMFILFFQELAKKLCSEIELINATEGGAYLEGYNHITLNEALEKVSDEKTDLSEVLNKFDLTEHELSKRKKKALKEFNLMLKNYKELKPYIVSAFKEGFAPYSDCDFEKKNDYNQRKYKLDVYIKSLINAQNMSPEEENIRQAYIDELMQFQTNLKNNINELLVNKPEKFAENLKIIKDQYLKIRPFIDMIPYHKSLYFNELLLLDHLINDFDNKDEELAELSYFINIVLFQIYYYWPIYNEKVEEINKELEK